MDLNLRQVRALLAVAEHGSFTRAASLLHLSQPALTVQIRQLEQTLGHRLLDRTSRGVSLTRVGRELLPRLAKTVHDADAVLHDAQALARSGGGTVRLAVLPSFAASLLPDLIRRFRQESPAMRFVVRDAVAHEVNALVAREEVDLGLTGGELDLPELEAVMTARDRLHLVFPLGDPIAGKPRLAGRDLAHLPLVLTARGTSVRSVVDAAFEALGIEPQLICEPTYMMTAVALVRAGLGYTILPEWARELRCEPELGSRPVGDRHFVRPVALVRRRGRTLPAAAESFMAALAAAG